MVWIPGNTFWMGSDEFYPEERPVHQKHVDGFFIDTHPVTVAEFRRFVKSTGYVTTAETTPEEADYPGADPALLVPGSLVFTPPPGPVPLDDYLRWWTWTPGADWRHPEVLVAISQAGAASGHTRLVLRCARLRALAGKDLPTEVEWEFAARGGLDRARFVWGDEFTPRGRHLANTWQGSFPWENRAEDGFVGTSPVGSFRVNGYGLSDMAGNVWEWTADIFTPDHATGYRDIAPARACCTPANPRSDVGEEQMPYPVRVIKGGSHLCAPNYCLRYRPAARQGESVETSTCHIGFRCIVRPSKDRGRFPPAPTAMSVRSRATRPARPCRTACAPTRDP